jgi:hypothetical protein
MHKQPVQVMEQPVQFMEQVLMQPQVQERIIEVPVERFVPFIRLRLWDHLSFMCICKCLQVQERIIEVPVERFVPITHAPE